MQRLALRTTVMGIAVVGLTAISTPASAIHSHRIVTPGTCVDKAGAGFGTDEVHTTTFPPSFHWQFHKGTPGTIFERPGHPLLVEAGLCPVN